MLHSGVSEEQVERDYGASGHLVAANQYNHRVRIREVREGGQ